MNTSDNTKSQPRHFVIMLGRHVVLAVRDTMSEAAAFVSEYLAANTPTQPYEVGNRQERVTILASLERAVVLGQGRTAHTGAESLNA